MKMISSAKLHKAMQALQRVVPFRQQIQSTIDHLLAADSEYISPLAQERPLQHVGIVLLGSDEGLCGAFNVTLFKHALDRIASLKEEGVTAITLYPIGKKVVSAAKKLRIEGVSVATTPYMSSKSTREEIEKMAGQLTDLFLSGQTDRIEVVFMHFISTGRQRVAHRTMLPVVAETSSGHNECKPYIFEPDVATIFDTVLPLAVVASLQECIGENRASEQAARVLAMQSANDNAKKLHDELQLEYNKLRQQSITNELLDILGGKVDG